MSEQWPTPTKEHSARNCTAFRSKQSPTASIDGVTLLDAMLLERGVTKLNQGETVESRIGGALNPAWVETLMGYPIGYTLPEGEPLCGLPTRWPAGLGAPQHEWEPPRLTTEKQHRAARLKCLGNSIVPQVAVPWMEAISADEGSHFER